MTPDSKSTRSAGGPASARRAMPASARERCGQQCAAAARARPACRRLAHARAIAACWRWCATPTDRAPLLASGSWEGASRPRRAGDGGFGYDPLFIPAGLCSCTRRASCRAELQERAQSPRARRSRRRCCSRARAGRRCHERSCRAAAAVAVRALPLVRAQVPVLRFQFAHAAGRAAGERLRRGAAARSGSSRREAAQGRERAEHLPRRRHAQPVLARGARRDCSTGVRARLAVRATMRRSRSRPIRARSSAGASPTIALPASLASPWARRASTTAQLQRLGRIHCAADTQRAVEELHAAGIDNFNLDLMYAPAAAERWRRRWPTSRQRSRSSRRIYRTTS